MTDTPPFSSDRFEWSGGRLVILRRDDASSTAEILCAMDPWKTLAVPGETMCAYLMKSDPALRKYSVFVEEKIAGIVAVRYPWLRGPYLELLAVFPEYQGRGIGRRIIEWMAVETSSRSSSIWVMVSGFNRPARSFYEREGFSVVAELPDFMKKDLVEILMRKVLAKDDA